MRKLGHGHSIMFFAPHDVDQRIRGLVSKENPNIQVTTPHILHWVIQETWNDIQRQAPHWAQQGMSHQSRYITWSRFCELKATRKELEDTWVQPELKSLEDMYLPCHSADTASSTTLPQPFHGRCEDLGLLSLRDIRLDEEQEREVSREIERERGEGPPYAYVFSAIHFLHPGVTQFVRTGVVPSPSWGNGFLHIFSNTIGNSLANFVGQHPWSPYILATADFCKTIEKPKSIKGRKNNYLRPVQWIISGKIHGKDALVLLSPFEADELLPEIRNSKCVHLHLYIPRMTKNMKPADDLRFYSIPPVPSDWTPPWELLDQLNIFAGQLYLRDYETYLRLCRFLRIDSGDPNQAGTAVARKAELFNGKIKSIVEGTALPIVKELLTARHGTVSAGTHMGRILEGQRLTRKDFE